MKKQYITRIQLRFDSRVYQGLVLRQLVASDDDGKRKSRRRFSAYREQGHEIDTHNV